MIKFPNCKINLGLNILARKKDGFHDIETIFFPVNIHDALEILPSKNNTAKLTVTGILPAKNEDNICLKAYSLLKKDFPQLPGLTIHLHKAIPLGAGLGGGSADAVSTLQLINDKFNLNIAYSQLFGYALKLGSDCPFFLMNRPCFATGRGEIMEAVDVSFSGYKLIIINPGISISTAEAFKSITPLIPSKRIREIIIQHVDTWKEDLVNDFEKPIFKKYPLVKNIKDEMYDKGAVYASMSGSGSTVYGIFKNGSISFTAPPGYFYKIIEFP
ncbi:MAG: 4-(cytidine 5'-diphospho)-2-C-methyl-D-erythritol kinase [Ginsengibacter sp.]